MNDSEPVNSYSIHINKKKYMFTCPDGEDHVREIERKLTDKINSVSGQEPGHILSDYAIKLALLLADDAISEKKVREKHESEIEAKVAPMLQELDRVLGMDNQF